MKQQTCFILLMLLIPIAESKKATFWHISDTHLQVDYKQGSDPETHDCVSGVGSAGKFGDYKCRTPLITLQAALHSFSSLPEKPSLIFWTGDATSQFPNDTYSQEGIQFLIENTTLELAKIASRTNARVFPVLGNHDSFPQCQFAAYNWIYGFVADLWTKYFGLSEESSKTIRKGGYYSENLNSKLKIIVVDTSLYYTANNQIPIDDPDPVDQIFWMKKKLTEARNSGQKVYLLSHHPLGKLLEEISLRPIFSDLFLRGLEGFHDIIIGSFFGHLHIDTFQLIGNSSLHPGFIAGHFGGDFGNNPNFRLFEFDSDTFELKDWITYYIDLEEANKIGKIQIKQLYRASELYGIPDLSLQSMQKAYFKISTNSTIFQIMYNFSFGNGPYKIWAPCNDVCRRKWLCATSHTYSADYSSCLLKKIEN